MEQEYRKEIFAKYLDNIREDIYTRILDANSELIHKLYNKRKNQNLRGNPLWLLHGGELINLYSDEKNKVRTKDIDLKLYFTGQYNIPYKIMEKSKKTIGSVNISNYDYMNNTKNDRDKVLKGFKKSMGKYYKIWEMGEKQKVNMCTSLLVNNYRGNFSQINCKTGKITDNKKLKDIKTSSTQKWMNGDDYSLFIINKPYITQVGRDNMPYNLSDDKIEKYGGNYDEDIDGYYIYDELIEDLDEELTEFSNKFMNKKNEREYLENKLMMIRIKNLQFKLTSVVGVIIAYNKSEDQLYLFQEGILDTYIDYSAGDHLSEELEYLGRYSDGSFPSIIKMVNYKGKKGVLKIPSLTWIIYDQLRMLYVVLRGEYLACNQTKCKWTELGGGAKNNSEKYFKKLSGLLLSFNNIINILQDGDIDGIRTEITKCKDTNIEKCGFSVFISSLYENLLFDILGKTHKKSKRKTVRDTKRRKKTQKKTGKFMNDLIMKNSDIF